MISIIAFRRVKGIQGISIGRVNYAAGGARGNESPGEPIKVNIKVSIKEYLVHDERIDTCLPK